MTTPQVIYLSAIAVYGVFFVLFARFFWWKRQSWRNHWGRRPQLTLSGLRDLAREGGRDLPRFTVLVPARNEAAVIAKTVDHLARLDYPKTHYEILVCTDEKESNEATRTRRVAVDQLLRALRARGTPDGATRAGRQVVTAELGSEGRELLLHLLAGQAMREYSGARGRQAGLVVPAALAWLPPQQRLALLRDLAATLIAGQGRISRVKLECLLERLAPGRTGARLREESGALLGLAIPIVAAYAEFTGDRGRHLMATMLREVAKVHHRVTKEIMLSMAGVIGKRLTQSLDEELDREGSVQVTLEHAAVAALPTTQDILRGRMAIYNGRAGSVRIKHIDVPYDFDGEYQGKCTGETVASTKGRALNFALAFVDPETEVCGFYDAESRPDPCTLMYVAWRRLVAPECSRVLQGPVFQVRNLFHMSPLCKIAALYQAVSHDWYLPQLFRRLPFVGGTNFFMERGLLHQLGGYDHTILTEDLELGVRAYMLQGAWPEYLPYASSEQTPPTLRGFFRQRLRWGTGHLQVMDKLRRDEQTDRGRRRQMLHHLLVKGQMEWCLYQLATMVPPTVLLLHVLGYVDPTVLPRQAHITLNAMTLLYFAFTFYIYTRYRGYVDMNARPRTILGDWSVVPQLILLPFAAFMFPVPYSTAMVLKGLGREPRAWVKTPRTVE